MGRDFRLTELHDRFAIKMKLEEIGADVLIVDNMSATRFSEDENDNNLAWGEAGDWIMKLRRRGTTVILIHHAGKSGEQRGASRREDFLDFSIRVTADDPENTQAKGLHSKINFSKFRSDDGQGAARPFEILLPLESSEISDGDGSGIQVTTSKSEWITQNVGASAFDLEIGLLREGYTMEEIGDEVVNDKTGKGLSASAVRKRFLRAIKRGVLSQEEYDQLTQEVKSKGAAKARQAAEIAFAEESKYADS